MRWRSGHSVRSTPTSTCSRFNERRQEEAETYLQSSRSKNKASIWSQAYGDGMIGKDKMKNSESGGQRNAEIPEGQRRLESEKDSWKRRQKLGFFYHAACQTGKE